MTRHRTPLTRRWAPAGAFAALLVLAAAAPPAMAETRGGVDLGVAVGTPTALELGLNQDGRVAFDLGFGADHLYAGAALYFDAEFALLRFDVGRSRDVRGRLYLGPGAEVTFASYAHGVHDHDHVHGDTELVVTAPFGTSFRFPRPVRLFAELRPGVGLIDHAGHFHLGGQFGVAYVF